MTDPLAGPGHNQPPEETPVEAAPALTVAESLELAHKALVTRYAELMALAEKAPAEVTDEETFKPLSDLLKAGRAYFAMSEAARKIENEESRRRTATIDAWFKNPAEKLKAALDGIKTRTDAYLEDKKAKEEKRRNEVAAEKARVAEERRWDGIWADALGELAIWNARKAEEREIAARLEKEAAARRADHLKDRAKRLKAVEPYLAGRAERRRLAAEKIAAERLKAAQDERARLEAEGERRLELEAEDLRRAQDAARLAQAQEKTATELAAAKIETTAARRQETSAGKAADKAIAQADEHQERAEDLHGEADRLDKRAERAERHANAGPAALSRTRSDLGTTSGLSRAWKMTAIDRSVVDLNLLRGFLHPDAIDVAARGFMMAHKTDPGGPKLAGCTFEQLEEGNYR